MEGFCRACLVKYDNPNELLEYTEKNRRLFIYCTGLQVKRNDSFPFQLCRECYLNMKLSCKFKKLCRTSDKKFRTYLSLKESGDAADLCTFLKSNDDNFTFRFPQWDETTSAANQKKDDDNVSTCTSIGNFMRDILQGTEMADTEARIISQVIAEEADVSDASLDSHWLQDDASIASDFRLDFSLFSTPRSVNNDHCYTPKRLADNSNYELDSFLKNPNTQNKDNEKDDDMKYLDDVMSRTLTYGLDNFDDAKSENFNYANDIEQISDILTEEVNSLTDDQINQVNSKNFYVDNNTLIEQTVINNGFGTKHIVENVNVCSIDVRLNEALQENHDEITLEDLLRSPAVYTNAAVPSTPTIDNILFGDTLDENSNHEMTVFKKSDDVQSETYPVSEKPKPVSEKLNPVSEKLNPVSEKPKPLSEKLDVLDEIKIEPKSPEQAELPEMLDEKEHALFLLEKIDDKKKKQIENENNDTVELVDCICTICYKKFKEMRVLKMHCLKVHKIQMPKAKKRNYYGSKCYICDHCGKKYIEKRYFISHLKTHEQITVRCDRCNLTFASKRDYDMHQVTHNGRPVERNGRKTVRCERCSLTFASRRDYNTHQTTHNGRPVETKGRKRLCTICGKLVQSSGMKRHLRHHARKYKVHCMDCGKGYYSLCEYRDHRRCHTGERPHECEICHKAFGRRNSLVRHMRSHTDELRYQCDNCNKKYANKQNLVNHIKTQRCSEFKITGKLNKIIRNARKKRNEITVFEMKKYTEAEIVSKPFECIYCQTRYKTENYLIVHQRSKKCRLVRENIIQRTVVDVMYTDGSDPMVEKIHREQMNSVHDIIPEVNGPDLDQIQEAEMVLIQNLINESNDYLEKICEE
ncbi:zinc finger and BTB domain-containing protein 41-like isoform X2 [Amyelois transitella]|uniref:zinc finger and BTB domain-containing protein 41-like isoform X2 n=1 Tax=Amyelois transitella TaxID=680683 RepID=UPI00299035CC|nr:zinc finger and BTB domain-containing protein 41-like isoform X2 [Amyelois transitella]